MGAHAVPSLWYCSDLPTSPSSFAQLLEDLKIMDYSLLLGIHRISKKFTPGVRRASVFVSSNPMLQAQLAEEQRRALEKELELLSPKSAAASASASQLLELVKPPVSDRTGVPGIEADGSPSDEVYFFGIIDILQQYDLKKQGETVLKSMLHPRSGISSVSPKMYATRYLKFLDAHTV